MNQSLLICIAFHNNYNRLGYLSSVIDNFINKYSCSVNIIVDTNVDFLIIKHPAVTVVSHTNLKHPFHLTSMHRQHIKDNIDKYDNFMYVEDDILLPFENYLNYLENFKLIYPKYVPSFIRIEVADGIEYVSDVIEPQPFKNINILGKHFTTLPFPFSYHGFWIMPQKELKESMKENFTALNDGREFNAMYVGWGLDKLPLVEIENNLISKKSYSYHLPNNYALSKESLNGKIKPENIFI